MDDIEILNSLNSEILCCFRDADAEALERIIGQEFYETDRVGRLRDRVSVLEKVRSSKGQIAFDISAEEVQIRLLGNSAIVHAKLVLSPRDGGAPQSGGRYTDVWMQVNGEWKAVAAHVSGS